MEYDYHKPRYTIAITLDDGTKIDGYFYPCHIKPDTIPKEYVHHYIYHQRNMSYKPLWIAHRPIDEMSGRFYGELLISRSIGFVHADEIWKIYSWSFGLFDIISRPANYYMTEVGIAPT